MRWPWHRKASGDQLVVSWSGQTLAYVLARACPDGTHEVLKLGVVRQATDSMTALSDQLRELGLKGMNAVIMLRPEQYQLLQINTPKVPPEELRSAARYQVREMLQTHVDDVTIDVMQVGDGQQKGGGQSFVVAATNAVVRQAMTLADAMNWQVAVIDIEETAQRNLQSALARRDGVLDRANGALTLVAGQQAVLTISANEELFYTRRFEVPEGFLTSAWGQGVTVDAPIDGFTPVQEYVPQHGSGDITLDSVLPAGQLPPSAAQRATDRDDERAQRLVLEIQRSLDVWDRTWSVLPLNRLRVFAGERSAELAAWLAQQLGQTVTAIDVSPLFSGLEAVSASDLAMCFPLLGVLLRTEGPSL